jgi:hypothetical protein
MQTDAPMKTLFYALQNRCLKQSASYCAKTLRLPESGHEFIDIPGRGLKIVDVNKGLALLFRKSATVCHSLHFHNSPGVCPHGQGRKTDQGFSGPVENQN